MVQGQRATVSITDERGTPQLHECTVGRHIATASVIAGHAQALEGLPCSTSYRPLLFAALLGHWGHKGPAEIEPKRAWTFRHVAWLAHQQGVVLQTLAQRLAPQRDPQSSEVKQALRDATDTAIAEGVFGVPTFEVDGRLFWGLDSIEMLVAYLQGDTWFDGPGWQAPRTAIPGVVRMSPARN